MKAVYPLALPAELEEEVQQTAKSTGLSKTDVMCQSIKLGLPQLRDKLPDETGRLFNLSPWPASMLADDYADNVVEADYNVTGDMGGQALPGD